MKRFASYVGVLAAASTWLAPQAAPELPGAKYHLYGGSTHAHTSYTWSHGDHLTTNGCAGILTYERDPSSGADHWSDGYVAAGKGCPAILVIHGVQVHAPGVRVKPDWTSFQGPPAAHFSRAKAAGYDFYAVTDHSQEIAFQPTGPDTAAWMDTKQQAAAASDNRFVGLAGFELSENDGPGGTGHINVFNSADMLNALQQGVNLPVFYKWLTTARANGDGPVLASFNHPDPDQYASWANRDARVTDAITMLEVINSNNKIHYPAFINALDHGWKVSPVAGDDNHGFARIAKDMSRTLLLTTALTKTGLLDAMQHRRTYASLDTNLQCRYSVNGAIMGSTLDRPTTFRFDIAITDPDAGNPKDRITRIDIVKDKGVVVQTYSPTPSYTVRWTPSVDDAAATYFFVRVWTAGGGDAPGADPANPVAWLAPVWTGR